MKFQIAKENATPAHLERYGDRVGVMRQSGEYWGPGIHDGGVGRCWVDTIEYAGHFRFRKVYTRWQRSTFNNAVFIEI